MSTPAIVNNTEPDSAAMIQMTSESPQMKCRHHTRTSDHWREMPRTYD